MTRLTRLAVAGLLVALTGCGLPLTDGPRSGGDDTDARDRSVGIKVLPPGPQPGATAEQLVRGFLAAQVSPDDDFAVARQFLAPGAVWAPEGEAVELFQPGSEQFLVQPDDPSRVRLVTSRTALLSPGGAYRPLPGTQPSPAVFRVERQVDGELRIVAPPPGLRLRVTDLDTSFVQQDVYFLSRATVLEASSRLVADRRFLPRGGDTARALVTALVDGPSEALEGSVVRVVPEGTRVLGVGVDGQRQVTVDLSAEAAVQSRRDRQRLSASLVWTLQDYTGVRLLVDGRPLDLAPVGEVATVEDWEVYDPSGLTGPVPLYYVQDRRLRIRGGSGQGDAASGAVRVDEVAVDPAGSRLAVLTQGARPQDPDELRVGAVDGALGEPVLSRPGLGSLSWGSGDRGLFVLEQSPAGPRLLLLPGAGTTAVPTRALVPVPRPAGTGPLSRVEVSRDGVRVALVFGTGDGRRLQVGRLQPTAAGVVVVDPQPVAPGLRDVADVAWESGTMLAVIANDEAAAGRLVQQVAVDGSSVVPLPRPGVTGTPVGLAAAPDQPIVVAVDLDGRATGLYVDDGQVFGELTEEGSAPTYPG